MATQYEDQGVRMAEEVDVTFHKVFSDISPVNAVRLILVYLHHSLSWCDSCTSPEWGTGYHCATRSGCLGSHPCSRVWGLTSPDPFEQSCASLWDSTPPILLLSDVPYIGTPPVGCSLIGSLINPQHAKWDCSPKTAPDDQPGKKAHAQIPEAKASSGHSTLQSGEEPLKMPPEVHNNGADPPKSTQEHNSLDNTDHNGEGSTQDELRENAINSHLESASGDYLSYWDICLYVKCHATAIKHFCYCLCHFFQYFSSNS